MRSPKRFYEFGTFRIDTVKRLLLRGGEPIALKSKCFETLLALVEARGQVLEKDELMRRIWPDTIVEESNLTGYISTLRKALGENHREHRYIVTVSGRGYSFVAEVKEVGKESAELIPQEHSGLSLVTEEGEVEGSPEREGRSFLPLRRISGFPSLPWRWRHRRSLIIAGLVLFSLATIIVAIARVAYFSSSKSDKAIHSLAILPFTIATDDPDVEYLADGIANDLANRLSRLPALTVISSNAVSRYKAHAPQAGTQDAQAIGREFKVEVVVVGRVAQRGDRIYINVELIDVRNNDHLWGEQYDRKIADIFSAQKDIASGISNRLRLSLTEKAQNPGAKRGTESIEAYRAYLKGRHFWNKRTEEGLRKAIEFFNQAIDLDPLSPIITSELGYSYFETRQYDRAIEEFRKAVVLFPDFSPAHSFLSMALEFQRIYDEALVECQKAMALANNDKLLPRLATIYKINCWD